MPPVSMLDRPATAKQLWPLSVEAYHALGDSGLIPEKTELLYGFVFNKMPKSPLHTFLTQLLFNLLQAVCPLGTLVRQEQPITSLNSEPEPDVAVVLGSATDFREAHPVTAELVIEVAINTKDYDRDKAAAYASAGVKEFWIVVVPEQTIEIYRHPVGEIYETKEIVTGSALAVSTSVPSFSVAPAVLFQN